MSLLMDALRKAEADKQAAARRDDAQIPSPGGTDTPGARGELRLEPLDDMTGEQLGRGDSGESDFAEFGSPARRFGISGRFRAASAEPTVAAPLALSGDDVVVGERESPGLARPELVTTQTLFSAGPARGRGPALTVFVVTTLIAVAGLGVLGYLYYSHTPTPPALPSPRVVDAVPVATPQVAAPGAPAAAPVVMLPAPAPPAVEVPPVAAAPQVPAASPESAPPAPTFPSGIAADMHAIAAAPPPAPSAAAARTTAREHPTEDVEMTSGDVRIARLTPAHRSALGSELTRAYAAYLAGDTAHARQAYADVLARDSRQVDALLGMGALALADNRLAEAYRYYSRVLSEDRAHPVATAALASIAGGAGDPATEARLKLLLDRGIDAPYLHFALGTLYARQARWPDAQAAFFEALRGSPRNADYAYNLAVSLDHLGQPAAALDYYRKAREFAAGSPAGFDGAALAARIEALAEPATR